MQQNCVSVPDDFSSSNLCTIFGGVQAIDWPEWVVRMEYLRRGGGFRRPIRRGPKRSVMYAESE